MKRKKSIVPSKRGGAHVAAEFEVFGIVQGCYFAEYCKDTATDLGINGWIKYSRRGTAYGILEGRHFDVEKMIVWLSEIGSPSSRIDKCVIHKQHQNAWPDFRSFKIRL